MKRPEGFRGTVPPAAPSPKRGTAPTHPRKLWRRKRSSRIKTAHTPHTLTTHLRDTRSHLVRAQRERRRYERAEVKRFTQRSRTRRRIWFIGASTVIAMIVFVFVGAYSPLMALQTIQVEGTARINANDVSAALGIYIGQPLPLIDAQAVQSQLENFSAIHSFAVESRPPHTILIRITERIPLGVMQGGAGFDLVDSTGVVIETTAERPSGFPLINASGRESNGFRAVSTILPDLPQSRFPQVDTISATTADDVTLQLTDGFRVIWGGVENSERKAIVLEYLLRQQNTAQQKTIDVSSPNSPIVR